MIWFSRIGLYLSFVFWIPVHNVGLGQNSAGEDSTLNMSSKKSAIVKKHNPAKASIYSMILPGLGQAYNKKYWKIPVVYAGFGVFYYFIQFNDKEYKAWRAAYNHTLLDPLDTEPPVNDYELYYGDRDDALTVFKDQKDYYRRNRDLTYILTSIWYLLNIVDATVDAHLLTWEIDENLSMKIEPAFTDPMPGYKPNGGVRLTLEF